MRVKIVFVLALGIMLTACSHQFNFSKVDSGQTYSMRGYFVDLWSAIIFIPCNGQQEFRLPLLKNDAFEIGTVNYPFGVDLYPTYRPAEGEYDAQVNDGPAYGNKFFERKIYYWSARVKIRTHSVKELKSDNDKYSILVNGQLLTSTKYFFENSIIEIEPYNQQIKREYYEYLKTKNYQLPQWAIDLENADDSTKF